jgi:hypothetical protein
MADLIWAQGFVTLRSTIDEGFQIDDPHVFIKWGLTEDELIGAIGSKSLKCVTSGYYTTACTSLSGLKHKLGFHFLPRSGGRLTYFEFFREQYDDLKASFDDFQAHLEATFGLPSATYESWIGFPACRWQIEDINILHYALDRFGPEEHVTIRKGGGLDSYWSVALRPTDTA